LQSGRGLGFTALTLKTLNRPNPTMSQAKKGAAAQRKKSPLIVVVDDEPMIGEVVEAILQLEGYRTAVFENPVQALRAVTELKPNLLLTDFVMPSMNGMELIEHSKKCVPELKTILFSGNFGEDIMSYYRVKPNKFLCKPFQPKALTELVREVLES
jgi:DNA-binding NtrC family response regulator